MLGLGALATERRRARLDSYLKHLVAAVARETAGGRDGAASATGESGRALAALAKFISYDPVTGVPIPAAAAAASPPRRSACVTGRLFAAGR